MKTIIHLFIVGFIFILPQNAQAQLLSVSGYVKNFITGQAVENATVYEAVSGIGTITNKDGYYRLLLNRGQQELKISSAGYETFTSAFKIASDTIISIDLIRQNMPENRVVAGNKLKKDLTEAVEKAESVRKRK